MYADYKALIVVLVIGTVAFWFGSRLCGEFIDPNVYKRRRNVWYALTVLAYASPSIWVFAAVAMPLMYVSAKRDPNPLALYALVMFAVPNIYVPIPAVGIGQVFDASFSRMMAFSILVPALFEKESKLLKFGKGTTLDWLLIFFILYELGRYSIYESSTNTLRRGFLHVIDTFLVYYAFSRLPPTKRHLSEILATFAVTGGILAALALFESVRGWLLYQRIGQVWGVPDLSAYLQRGNSLRAQVSTGHSLVLGYTVAFCLSFWLYIQSSRTRSFFAGCATLGLLGGLAVSYSRGAWIMAALSFVVFMALRPGATKFFVRFLPVLALAVAVLYLSPLKEVIIDRLPIIGKSDQDTVSYRQLVFDVSWRLIKLNPLFGDPNVTNSLEELRQGQGIIDLINGYIIVSLYYGLVGLALFVSFFLMALGKCFAAVRRSHRSDEQVARMGASLVACMLGSLFFIATAGYGSIEYLLSGILACYAALGSPKAVETLHLRRRTNVKRSFAGSAGWPAA